MQAIRGKTALLCDADGTLWDSQPLHLAAWREVFQRAGISHEVTQSDILGIAVSDFLKKFGLPTEYARKKKERLLQLAGVVTPRLYPNVENTLRILSQHLTLAMVSNCEPDLVQVMRRRYPVLGLFNEFVLEGNYLHAKPDPEPYLNCLARLGIPAGQAIAVEDSPSGLLSAWRAGCTVVAVATTTAVQELRPAHFVINDFGGLIDLVRTL